MAEAVENSVVPPGVLKAGPDNILVRLLVTPVARASINVLIAVRENPQALTSESVPSRLKLTVFPVPLITIPFFPTKNHPVCSGSPVSRSAATIVTPVETMLVAPEPEPPPAAAPHPGRVPSPKPTKKSPFEGDKGIGS